MAHGGAPEYDDGDLGLGLEDEDADFLTHTEHIARQPWLPKSMRILSYCERVDHGKYPALTETQVTIQAMTLM